MDGVMLPFLPASLWLFAVALAILILLIFLGFFAYVKKKMTAIAKNAATIAELSIKKDQAELLARKQQLEADVGALREWTKNQEGEIERIKSERVQQERDRAELESIKEKIVRREADLREMRKDAGELENNRHMATERVEELKGLLEEIEKKVVGLKETCDKLENGKKELLATLVSKKVELDKLEGEIDDSKRLLQETAKAEIKHDELLRVNGNLEIEIGQKIQKIKELNVDIDKVQENYDKIKEERNDLEKEISGLNIKKSGIMESINDLLKEKDQLSSRNTELKVKKIHLEQRVVDLNNQKDNLEGKTKELIQIAEQAQKDATALEVRVDSLNRHVTSLQNDKTSLDAQIQSLKTEEGRLDKKITELEEKEKDRSGKAGTLKKDLKEIQGQIFLESGKLSKLNDDLVILRNERSELEARLGYLKGEIRKSKKNDTEGTDPYGELLKNRPPCLNPELLPGNPFPYEEEQALAEIYSRLENAGYDFHERVIKAFHTSLKCHEINPLTVLAGVSGTGKTLLPRAYARIMGMYSLVIPVQPRWDSPQDMFGFYNYYEKRYRATELASALIRMDPFITVPRLNEAQKQENRMLLVLLDEMNLARTEYYFSEFLSKLELKRDAGSLTDAKNRRDAVINLDTGPGGESFSFLVGKNVLFTGTMNEDESTQTLSDKVLDRANVLRFGRPSEWDIEDMENSNSEKALPDPLGFLSKEHWVGWQDMEIRTTHWTSTVLDWINEL